MHIEDGTVVLEMKDCWSCKMRETPGLEYGRKVCSKCNGTKDGPRGGKNKCRQCAGSFDGTEIDVDNLVTCSRCGGNWEKCELESYCDSMPGALLLEHVPEIKLYRSTRRTEGIEMVLGSGFWTTCDYGSHTKLPDGELIEKVRAEIAKSKIQVVKFVRSKDDLRLPSHLGIFTSSAAYFPAAVFASADEEPFVKVH